MELFSKKLLMTPGAKKLSRRLFVQTELTTEDDIFGDPQWAYISEDGVSWKLTNCPGLDSSSSSYSGIRYWAEKGIWYRTHDRYNGSLLYSYDGINWQTKTFTTENNYFRDGGGKLLVFPKDTADPILYYTTDMVTWRTTNLPYSNQYAVWRKPDYGNSLWLVFDTGPNKATNYLQKSSNGINWSSVNLTADYLNDSYVYYFKNRFYAVKGGGTNVLSWSTNGSSWTKISSIPDKIFVSLVEANNMLFVINVQNIFYSTDGINFNQSTFTGESPADPREFTSLCYSNGVYLASNKYGVVGVSTDGKTWNIYNLYDISIRDFKMVAVDHLFICSYYTYIDNKAKYFIKTSEDGYNWKTRLESDSWFNFVEIL